MRTEISLRKALILAFPSYIFDGLFPKPPRGLRPSSSLLPTLPVDLPSSAEKACEAALCRALQSQAPPSTLCFLLRCLWQ